MRIRYEGELGYGVGAKDLILGTIGRIGPGGGARDRVRGRTDRAAVDGGSHDGLQHDDRSGGPGGDDRARREDLEWLEAGLPRPTGCRSTTSGYPQRSGCEVRPRGHDRRRRASPQVTWGTTPAMVVDVTGAVPEPRDEGDRRALDYMALEPGTPMREIRLDRVFVGSCTNSRIGDLREAAEVARPAGGQRGRGDGRPGSQQVKAQAEAEGLDEVFRAAGFDWRSAGCSMCLGMNPDILAGERCASTSNRNFEGRQGRGGRTHLVSPRMAAAAAIEGRLVDVREAMRAVGLIEGGVTVLDRSDVDTDQIIPKQFLKRVERSGFGEFLFHDWAKEPGCCCATRSSPRDATSAAAPRASTRRGARGLRLRGDPRAELRRHLLLELHEDRAAAGGAARGGRARGHGGAPCRCRPRRRAGDVVRGEARFEIDPEIKRRLLNGLDDIGVSLQSAAAIDAYERERERPGPVTTAL